MKFTKMQGIGNDYIYVNCFEEQVENPRELAKRISDRHFGVGSDGLVLICPDPEADFRMRMYNSDGSESEMCGNATRCIGKYVYERGLTDKTEVRLMTGAGIKILSLRTEQGKVTSVRVDMGTPEVQGIGETVEANGKRFTFTRVSMGNPHAVIFTEDADGFDVEELLNSPVSPASACVNGVFLPGPKGVSWVFQPYEIAPYSFGIITVEVPWKELKAWVR